MKDFFYPASVAVVGVSEDPANLGRGIVANLIEFNYQGKFFLVGPRGGTLFGLPIYTSLQALPQKVDLAVILAPARVVASLVAQCGELGITRVVVESAGFSELSEAGKVLEGEILAALQKYNMRLVGPNGIGLMNLELGLAVPFSQMRPRPPLGSVSIISQSGGVGMHLLAWLTQEGLGLNKFLSLGNKLNVGENEALAYFLEDPGTSGVYVYLEGLSDGRGLMEAARGATKPIFLHMPNAGPETAAIAHSHSASLAADDKVLDAACRQAGIMRVTSQRDFLSAAKLLNQPPVRGNRLVALSRTGGQAVVIADSARRWGFHLAPISPRLAERIQARSRAGVIAPINPIDLGDVFDFTVYNDIMEELCRDPEVDAILFNYGPLAEFEVEAAREMARQAVEQARRGNKPLAVTVLATLKEEDFFRETLKVPVFHFPGEAIEALAMSRRFTEMRQTRTPVTGPLLFERERVAALLAQAPGPGFLPLPLALKIIEALGISPADWATAATPEEAAAAALRLGLPVCLKLSSHALIHKTEVGGVLLDLKEPGEVKAGFAQLAQVARSALPPGAPWEVVVMSQVDSGLEILLGATRDPSFGPVLAFGAGGIATEVLGDVSLKVAPIDEPEARGMMADTRLGQILAGIRGQSAADLPALARALTALSQLMTEFPQVKEVDLNPIKAFPGEGGILALDARIRVEEG